MVDPKTGRGADPNEEWWFGPIPGKPETKRHATERRGHLVGEIQRDTDRSEAKALRKSEAAAKEAVKKKRRGR